MTSDHHRQDSVRSVNNFAGNMASQVMPPPPPLPQVQTNGNGHPSPPSPSLQERDKVRIIDEILHSDVGVSSLLTRLKQSITACRDFAAFIKRRASLEEEHAQGLRKLCNLTHQSIRRPDGRQGTYAYSFDLTTRIHDRIADNGLQFSIALHQMHEDLMELSNNMDRGRKHWKQTGMAYEKKTSDAELLVEKAKIKYDTAADEYDRLRSGDRRSGKSPFSIRGSKKGPQHEEELNRKVQSADSDYQGKVQYAHACRQELVSSLRPQAVKSLREMIAECDSGLTVQLQRFAQFSEKLLLSNGLSVSPMKSDSPETRSMRDVVSLINNEQDFENYVIELSAKVPPQMRNQEVKYVQHHSQVPAQQLPSSTSSTNTSVVSTHQIQVPAGFPQLEQQQHQQHQHQHQLQLQHEHQLQQQQQQQQQLQQQHQQQQQYQHRQPQQQQQPQLQLQPQPQPQQQQQQHTIPQSQGFGAVVQAPAMLPVPLQQGQPVSVQTQYAGSNYANMDYPRMRPVFGQSLNQLLQRDESVVPILVHQCILAVDLYGLDVEGIYRLSGEKRHVERIKQIFDNDPSTIDFRKQEDFFFDVNSVASVLKQFFRELPDPLLTNALYNEFISASRIDDDITRRDSLHELINKLPDPNYATLRVVILHLNRVQANANVNRMNCGNLAICFGPTLMGSNLSPNIADAGWQVRVIDTILQHCFSIFDDDP